MGAGNLVYQRGVTPKGKLIGVHGLAFKGGTDDIRESPAINIIRVLLAEGCIVTAYDPAAMEKAQDILPADENLNYAHDEFEAACAAHALLVLTEWPQFARLDLESLREIMQYPIVIDGRNLFSRNQMGEAGFHYNSMGRPESDPAVLPRRESARKFLWGACPNDFPVRFIPLARIRCFWV